MNGVRLQSVCTGTAVTRVQTPTDTEQVKIADRWRQPALPFLVSSSLEMLLGSQTTRRVFTLTWLQHCDEDTHATCASDSDSELVAVFFHLRRIRTQSPRVAPVFGATLAAAFSKCAKQKLPNSDSD